MATTAEASTPCLQLLTEIASTDGAAHAKTIYAARDTLLRGLAKQLSGKRAVSIEGQAKRGRRDLSTRTAALRFVLTLFKSLDYHGKSELAGHRDITSAIFKDIKDDVPELIRELLSIVKDHLVLDRKVYRSAKAKFFNPWTLNRLVTLYSCEDTASDDPNSPRKPLREEVHSFLLLVCTKPSSGILSPEVGTHTSITSRENVPHNPSDLNAEPMGNIELDFNQLVKRGSSDKRYTIRNTILSSFIRSLRPQTSKLQSQLLIEIFKAAPELVADYFQHKVDFSIDFKATSTWMAYAAFLYSTVQLPLSDLSGNVGHKGKGPPLISQIIESVLPQPLSQSALTKCLHQKTRLISFFAVRYLLLSFQKLRSTLEKLCADGIATGSPWKRASQKLVGEFCQRCPKMKDIILMFRSTHTDDLLQRAAISELAAMYYATVPIVALEEKFDISIALTTVFDQLENLELPSADGTPFEGPNAEGENIQFQRAEVIDLRLHELRQLLYISSCAPTMRWFNKSGK
jgi:nucleolar pre-ribosomal-associated protein 1